MSLGFQIVLWSAVGRVYAVPQPCRSPISVVSRSVESMQSLNLVLNLIAFWALISSCENYDIFVTQPCCSPISVVSWSGRVYTVPQPRCSPFLGRV